MILKEKKFKNIVVDSLLKKKQEKNIQNYYWWNQKN